MWPLNDENVARFETVDVKRVKLRARIELSKNKTKMLCRTWYGHGSGKVTIRKLISNDRYEVFT